MPPCWRQLFATVTHTQNKSGDAHVAAEWLTPDDKPQQADTRRSSVCLPWPSIRFQSRSRGATAGPLAKPLATQSHKVDKEWMLTYDWMPDGNNTDFQQSIWSNCGTHTHSSGEGRRPEGLIRLTNHKLFLVGRDSHYGVSKYSSTPNNKPNTCNIRCKEIIAYLPRFSVSASRGKDNPSPPNRAHAHRIM